MKDNVSVATILGNTAEHYQLGNKPSDAARKGKKRPEQSKTSIDTPRAVAAQENDSRAVAFRDNLGRVVEIRPVQVLGVTRYGPRRLQGGEWVHVPTGGNVPAQLSRVKAIELLIQHAEFMGWDRVEVQVG